MNQKGMATPGALGGTWQALHAARRRFAEQRAATRHALASYVPGTDAFGERLKPRIDERQKEELDYFNELASFDAPTKDQLRQVAELYASAEARSMVLRTAVVGALTAVLLAMVGAWAIGAAVVAAATQGVGEAVAANGGWIWVYLVVLWAALFVPLTPRRLWGEDAPVVVTGVASLAAVAVYAITYSALSTGGVSSAIGAVLKAGLVAAVATWVFAWIAVSLIAGVEVWFKTRVYPTEPVAEIFYAHLRLLRLIELPARVDASRVSTADALLFPLLWYMERIARLFERDFPRMVSPGDVGTQLWLANEGRCKAAAVRAWKMAVLTPRADSHEWLRQQVAGNLYHQLTRNWDALARTEATSLPRRDLRWLVLTRLWSAALTVAVPIGGLWLIERLHPLDPVLAANATLAAYGIALVGILVALDPLLGSKIGAAKDLGLLRWVGDKQATSEPKEPPAGAASPSVSRGPS